MNNPRKTSAQKHTTTKRSCLFFKQMPDRKIPSILGKKISFRQQLGVHRGRCRHLLQPCLYRRFKAMGAFFKIACRICSRVDMAEALALGFARAFPLALALAPTCVDPVDPDACIVTSYTDAEDSPAAAGRFKVCLLAGRFIAAADWESATRCNSRNCLHTDSGSFCASSLTSASVACNRVGC